MWLDRTFTYTGAQRFYALKYRNLVNAYHDKPEGYDWRAETDAYQRLCAQHWPAAYEADWCDVGGDDCNPERSGELIETMPVTRTYDLVTCCQTLDHILDPVTAFHKFAQMVLVGGHLWVDIVDYRVTQEIKADHPLNWNYQSLMRAIPPRYWRKVTSAQIDDRHIGVLLERW